MSSTSGKQQTPGEQHPVRGRSGAAADPPLIPHVVEATLVELDRHAPPGVLNCRATLERLDGDIDLFHDLLGFYFRDVPVLLGEIASAIAAADAPALRRWAHRLKGLVSNFDAHRATQSAGELEQMGLDNRLEAAQAVYGRLEKELAEASLHLQRFLGKKATA